MSIQQRIRESHDGMTVGDHHRYRSWEHCYGFFRSTKPSEIAAEPDTAALHLGFYLASWGMLRGSTFLLQRAYTVHLEVIKRITSPVFLPLWKSDTDFGSQENDSRLDPIIKLSIQAVREAYEPFEATDTLVTKVILGTLGCLPACDRYFIEGLRSRGHSYSCVNARFIEGVRSFCRDHLAEFREEQGRIKDRTGVHYPLMKLVDMYFWQIGFGLKGGRRGRNSMPSLPEPKRTLSAAVDGVQSRTSANGVKRVSWYGHSGFSVARWCGAQGWSGAETAKVFDRLGIPLGKAAIIGGVYAGRAGKRGRPANLTRDQITQMDAAAKV